MCDDDIHQGLVDPNFSRRAFGLSAAAAAALAATMAHAQDSVVETDVDVKTPDGVADSALFYPKGKGKWPAVLIWTDIFGLRPVFRDMGRRLAAQGYVVLIPNPFYRKGRATAVGADGFDFSKPEERAKLMPIAASITGPGTVEGDAPAFFAYLDALPQTDKKKKAGTQGYCMGGPLVYRSAAVLPDPHRRRGHLPWRRPGHPDPGQSAPAHPQDEGRGLFRRRRQRRPACAHRQGRAQEGLRRRRQEGHDRRL